MGSLALSGVKNHFCTISGIKKLKLDIIIRHFRYWLVFCLENWCLILFCLNCVSLMLYKIGLNQKHTEGRMYPLLLKCSLLEKLWINPGGIKFQDIRLLINSNSWNLITHVVFFISRLPDIIQKCFCTPDSATDPIFQIRYVSAI